MGRGAVSKTTRKSNRAELAGNRNRGNCNAGAGYKKRRVKRSLYQEGDSTQDHNLFQRLIVHERYTYRVGYCLIDGWLCVKGIVRYLNAKDTSNYKIVDKDSQVGEIISKKLMITLNVETAKAEQ